MSLIDLIRAAVHTQTDISVLFLEFEEVLIIAIGFMLILMYLFYYKYPVNKDLE
jgi:hypothetical protein